MICQLCGGVFSVKDSRPAPKNTIRRIRECNTCEVRVVTYEAIEAFPTLKSKNLSHYYRGKQPVNECIGMS